MKKNQGRPKGGRMKEVLFSYGEWTIQRFDPLNISLHHVDDNPNQTRYYSTLGAALHGLAREVGFASRELQEAVESWDELNAKISALAL